MQLNHLNLCVENVHEARDFFRDLFGFQLADQKGDAIVVMNDGHGFTLVLSNPLLFGGVIPEYPKDFHIGFYVETPEEVDQHCDRLEAAGIPMEKKPKKIRGGYTLYFRALGGIMFEITCLAKINLGEK
ncbi:VOC family protein [Pseudogracilibacillus auburnensis]|uniref:VOC family protein n=1 Tax=Pseudogracilibacillus auburnensis TaxID=1494959 RepID=UPI001A961AA0|nr:VOC family protein [Pseudogracilibacillus auburnensis]MBO1005038.1 VOC family protein [Pseudogracilibacillus auburnensis]